MLLFANSFIRFFGDTMKAQYGKAELVIDYIDKASADSLKMPEQVIDYSRVAWLGSAKMCIRDRYIVDKKKGVFFEKGRDHIPGGQ